jgi:transcriptional regulator with XRE-family HTH domain
MPYAPPASAPAYPRPLLARIVGVTPATISNLEQGRTPRSAETVFWLAQVLGVPYSTF